MPSEIGGEITYPPHNILWPFLENYTTCDHLETFKTGYRLRVKDNFIYVSLPKLI